MTITVVVKHNTPSQVKRVEVRVAMTAENGDIKVNPTNATVIEPGKEASFTIWDTQHLFIKEVP